MRFVKKAMFASLIGISLASSAFASGVHYGKPPLAHLTAMTANAVAAVVPSVEITNETYDSYSVVGKYKDYRGVYSETDNIELGYKGQRTPDGRFPMDDMWFEVNSSNRFAVCVTVYRTYDHKVVYQSDERAPYDTGNGCRTHGKIQVGPFTAMNGTLPMVTLAP